MSTWLKKWNGISHMSHLFTQRLIVQTVNECTNNNKGVLCTNFKIILNRVTNKTESWFDCWITTIGSWKIHLRKLKKNRTKIHCRGFSLSVTLTFVAHKKWEKKNLLKTVKNGWLVGRTQKNCFDEKTKGAGFELENERVTAETMGCVRAFVRAFMRACVWESKESRMGLVETGKVGESEGKWGGKGDNSLKDGVVKDGENWEEGWASGDLENKEEKRWGG